jgi:hypothetical protein
MALGVSLVFLSGAMLRRGSGRDVYATIFREWTWAAALGLSLLAAAWEAGMNLIGAVLVAAVLLPGAGVALLRGGEAFRPRAPDRAVPPSPARGGDWAVRSAFAAVAAALAFQGDLLSAAGAYVPVRLMCLASSVALLAWSLRRWDHKSAPPGAAQGAGMASGVPAVLLLQAALALLGSGGGAGGVLCLIGAALLQVPLAVMAGGALSRQRRRLAAQGMRGRVYLANVFWGLGAGCGVSAALGEVPHGPVVLLMLVIALMAAGLLRGVASARTSGVGLRWAAWGGVLLCAASGGAVSVFAGPHGSAAASLPACAQRWRSSRITDVTEAMLSARRGRWWIVAGCLDDIPSKLPNGVRVALSPPAPAVRPPLPAGWSKAAQGGATGDFLMGSQVVRDCFDGLLLAPVPADCPDAWRYYNFRTLRRCASHVHAGGVVLLRVQARRAALGAALRIARTFHSIVGSGWLVAEMSDEGIDMLLVGPAGVVKPPASDNDAVAVVELEHLWDGLPDVRTLRLTRPGAAEADITYWTLFLHLRDVRSPTTSPAP